MKKLIGNIVISVGISVILCFVLFLVLLFLLRMIGIGLSDIDTERLRVMYLITVLVSSVYIYEDISDETNN